MSLEQQRQNKIEMDAGLSNRYRMWGGTASGTNTYAVTLNQGLVEGYFEGMEIAVTFTNANTGGSTIAVNGLSPADITNNKAGALTSGQIEAGSTHKLYYDGTQFRALSIG